ncbi:MAG TPA: serine/threonine-protein kinase [Kofleriaceae bacterium]
MTCPACDKDVLDIDVKCGHCGAALGASGAHRLIGTVMLGQYELVDVLGQGGMSVVFKGRHKLTDQEVALKILPPELAAHSQVKSRFLDEAKALAALDHPNIVHLYNFGQDEGYFVLAMQFVEGQTWERKILEAERLDWIASCRIAIDVLRALEYAHGRGVIHRDMKPSNVLVRGRDGVATVMDFGIAKMTTSTRLTATGQTMGTVRYMSPEQVRGQEVDLRTDIYSLGATLYESLVGDTPFSGNTHFEIMTKHLSDAPRRPSKLGITMPEAIEGAVMRCLAKRPEDRFGSAREMRKQLEATLRDADVGLVETQKLERDAIAPSRAPAKPPGLPTAPLPGRPVSATGALADELEPETPHDGARASSGKLRRVARARREPGGAAAARRRRLLPWVAVALAALVGGGAAATALIQRSGRYQSTVQIAGVALIRGTTAGKLLVETDGTVEPDELAGLYTRTLEALRVFVRTQPGVPGLVITDPVDVLLAVPAAALCEPTAYFDRQTPPNCAATRWATAIGARGTHRLMVVSDRAQLAASLRRGVAQAACEFSPVAVEKLREICDITSRFAESPN